MEFEWDPAKAKSNRSKHGVSFAEAVGVLEDELGLTIEDERHFGERRFLTVGSDYLGRLLAVSFTWRADRIRLISARRATKGERRQYEEGT